jgi:2-methylisocitrate lyase-like PEP mutase family enzyme
MPTQAEAFRALHHGPTPLILPNAWDPVSARVIAEAGYPAIATSSGAVARVLGYDDGQLTPPAEMFEAVARIARAVDIPVTADMEAGYGLDPREFAERLLATGAVGCNLEDSIDDKLVDVQQHADHLCAVRAAAGADLVINARIDDFFTGGTVEDAIDRGRAYRRAGVDCIYPIFAPTEVFKTLADEIGGPINAHATPDGPDAADLIALGATRISYGTSLHAFTTTALRELLRGPVNAGLPRDRSTRLGLPGR